MIGSVIASISLIVFSNLYVPPGKFKITLYADNGIVIKSWESTYAKMLTESIIKFKDSTGKYTRISGTIVMEDL